jgi:hypothetical protein
MQSICDQLLFEQAKERRELKKIKFIWTDRDPVIMEELSAKQVIDSKTLNESNTYNESITYNESNSFDESTTSSSNESNTFSDSNTSNDSNKSISGIFVSHFAPLLTVVPPGRETNQELEQMYASLDLTMDLDAELLDESDNDADSAETSLADNQEPWDLEDSEKFAGILDMQLYMTNKHQTDFNLPNVQFGRPDLKKMFLDMKEEAEAKGEKRIAVCVCAPQKISDICHKACIVYSNKHVQFDFHTEIM